VLAAPEVNVLPSALLLRLLLVVPQKGGQAVQLLPEGGVELLFSVSAHPQIDDLLRWSAQQVGERADGVVLVKWISGERRWRVMPRATVHGERSAESGHVADVAGEEVKRPPSTESPMTRRGQGGQQGAKGAVPSLLSAPHHLHQQGQCHSPPDSSLLSLHPLSTMYSHCAALGFVCVDWVGVLPLRLFPSLAAVAPTMAAVEETVEDWSGGWPSPILRAQGGEKAEEEGGGGPHHRLLTK
jgi:hypothetical protein